MNDKSDLYNLNLIGKLTVLFLTKLSFAISDEAICRQVLFCLHEHPLLDVFWLMRIVWRYLRPNIFSVLIFFSFDLDSVSSLSAD